MTKYNKHSPCSIIEQTDQSGLGGRGGNRGGSESSVRGRGRGRGGGSYNRHDQEGSESNVRGRGLSHGRVAKRGRGRGRIAGMAKFAAAFYKETVGWYVEIKYWKYLMKLF